MFLLTRDTAFPSRLHVLPAKTDQSVHGDQCFLPEAALDHWLNTEYPSRTDQTAWMHKLVWVHIQSYRKCCAHAYQQYTRKTFSKCCSNPFNGVCMCVCMCVCACVSGVWGLWSRVGSRQTEATGIPFLRKKSKLARTGPRTGKITNVLGYHIISHRESLWRRNLLIVSEISAEAHHFLQDCMCAQRSSKESLDVWLISAMTDQPAHLRGLTWVIAYRTCGL